jgi:1-acyl-sn-glycerol-3-phosphate acyltransferase
MPFRLGAFVAAAQARVAVIPVAIRGTRSVLRAGQWLPRRGLIVVTIGTPIQPPADAPDDFAAAVRLADAARAEILRHCGESDAASQTQSAQSQATGQLDQQTLAAPDVEPAAGATPGAPPERRAEPDTQSPPREKSKH